MEYEQRQIALEGGDVLLLYTDGIVEAMNAKEDLFGLGRLKSSLAAAGELPAQGILDSILRDLGAVHTRPGAVGRHNGCGDQAQG